MKVAGWGNSLAIRLPRAVVSDLALKEGDDVTLTPAGLRCLAVARDHARQDALACMDALSRPLPPDYRFDRDEIYDRFGPGSAGRKD